LIVEDHADTVAVLRRLLEMQGFGVASATTVAAAQAVVSAEPVDLIVTDRLLPDGTGDDLLAWVRRRGTIVPVVALTGDVTRGGPERARAAGYCAVLAKPVDFATLLAEVTRCLPARLAS
jgi:DNA-binding response OmpR family regulator